MMSCATTGDTNYVTRIDEAISNSSDRKNQTIFFFEITLHLDANYNS